MLFFWLVPHAHAQTEGRARVQIGHEIDSNPKRLVFPVQDDQLMRLILEAELSHISGVQQWSVSYLGGLKLHYNQSSEDLIATQLNGFYGFSVSPSLGLGVRLSFLDTSLREHDRDYLIWTGEAFLHVRLMTWLSMITHLGGSFFYFKPDGHGYYRLKFTHRAPTALVKLDARLARKLIASVFYQLEWRFFDDRAYQIIDELMLPSDRDRYDRRHMTGLSVRYEFETFKDKFMIVELSYSLSINDSNSIGSSANWHRLKLVTSMQLPLNMNLHLMGSLQLTQYKDAMYIEGNLYEPDADENENSLVLRLSIPLVQDLSMIVQAGLYRNDFHSDHLRATPYQRETLMIGLDYELPF